MNLKPLSLIKPIVLLALALFATSSFSYDAPVGIPEPVFGKFHPIEAVSPAHPSGWPSQEVENYYYIDNTHPNATDSGNPYGTPDKPRESIPEKTYSAGSYVEIHGGPYTGGGQIIFTANGTEDNPVWIRGGDPNNKALIRGEMIGKGQYFVVENLRFDESRKTLKIREHKSNVAHYVSVRNNEFSGPGYDDGYTAVLSASGGSGNRASNIVFYKNTVHGFGNTDRNAKENDYHGIIVHTNVDYVWVLENTIYDNGGDSIQIGTASTADSNRVSHVYVGGNDFSGDRENAVDIKEADNVVISSNIMYDYAESTSSAGEVVIIHNNATNVYVINNRMHTASYGVMTTSAINTWVIGNTIWNIHNDPGTSWDNDSLYSAGAAIHFRGDTTGGAINNTIYDYDTGIQLASGSNYTIANNIFLNRATSNGYDLLVNSSSIASSTDFMNNLFYGHEPRFMWNGSTVGVSGLKSEGECNGCVTKDPKLAVGGAGVASLFTAASDSPVKDAGANIASILQDFTNIYGVSITKDLFGNSRFSGAIDIGAFEIGGNAVSAPNPPSNINITLE